MLKAATMSSKCFKIQICEDCIHLAQTESQEESNVAKMGLYFSVQPERLCLSSIFFSIFEKFHGSFLNKPKSKETEYQVKTYLFFILPICNSIIANSKWYLMYFPNIVSLKP